MHWGANGRSGGAVMEPVAIAEDMTQSSYHHGANIARVTKELKGKNLFAEGNVALDDSIGEFKYLFKFYTLKIQFFFMAQKCKLSL